MPQNQSQALRTVVGVTAVIAPILHSITDAMEWYQGGFSPPQLWLNYVAFLPMPWLLLGLYTVSKNDLGICGLIGALLYGAAFTYFAHTTLFALASGSPNYESLWQQLGPIYTLHGGFMVAGGMLFAWAAVRATTPPKIFVGLFAAGLVVNLCLALLPAPDILQTLGTALRNIGIVGMGYATLTVSRRSAA